MISEQSRRTIHVRKKQLNSLLKDAENSGVGVDAMVDRVLADHDWNKWAAKAGFVQLHKTLIRNLFENVSEETARRLAADLANESKGISFMMAGEYNLESTLDVFKKMITKSGFLTLVIDKDKFLFQHNLGTNCSIFYAALFAQLIKDLGRRSEIFYTKKTLSIKIL